MKAERTYKRRVARFATQAAALRFADACAELVHGHHRAYQPRVALERRNGRACYVVSSFSPLPWKGDR